MMLQNILVSCQYPLVATEADSFTTHYTKILYVFSFFLEYTTLIF
jgi:hypothetical protein